MTKYFEILETGSPEGPNKVNGIRAVLERLNVDAKDALYVGDAPSDIRYCKQIGVPIAAAAWASTTNVSELTPLEPDFLFTSVDDFKSWLSEQLVG